MNNKALILTFCISLMSSSTLFLKTESNEKLLENSTKKDPSKYVNYKSFGDFFEDDTAYGISTDKGGGVDTEYFE